ncbi:MAG: GreA/GreB family elongation factor [Candidatus Binatia bacterium]
MDLPVVQRLKKELQDLQYELSHKLPKELEEARAHGDLSENAEYEAAKARQEIVQVRISQIGGRIRELSLYTMASIPAGVVAYGSRVTLEDLEEGGQTVYHLVFPEEADAAQGRISLGSPLGRALLNRSVDDEIEVQAPKGKRRYQIVDLVTVHEMSDQKST